MSTKIATDQLPNETDISYIYELHHSIGIWNNKFNSNNDVSEWMSQLRAKWWFWSISGIFLWLWKNARWTDQWTDQRMDQWTDQRMYQWMDQQMDQQMEYTERRTDRLSYRDARAHFIRLYLKIYNKSVSNLAALTIHGDKLFGLFDLLALKLPLCNHLWGLGAPR